MVKRTASIVLVLALCLFGKVSAQDTIYYDKSYTLCCECSDVDSIRFSNVVSDVDLFILSMVVYMDVFVFHSWTASVEVKDMMLIKGGFVLFRKEGDTFPYSCLKPKG